MLADMHLGVYAWFACRHTVPMLSLDMLSFQRHMVKWLDVAQAIAVSVCIADKVDLVTLRRFAP